MPPVTPRTTRAPAYGRRWPLMACGSYSAALAPRRRGTTRYSIEPDESSSSERVVSFFSFDDERSRGNSFSARACFAATRTPRYLFAALAATSPGVKTRIIGHSGMIFQFCLEPPNQRGYLLPQPCYPFPAYHFGVDDGRHPPNRIIEHVIHDHVFVILDRLQLLQR